MSINTDRAHLWQAAMERVARQQEATATFPAPLEAILSFSEGRSLHIKVAHGAVHMLPSGKINMSVDRFSEITASILKAHKRWLRG